MQNPRQFGEDSCSADCDAELNIQYLPADLGGASGHGHPTLDSFQGWCAAMSGSATKCQQPSLEPF